MNYDHVINCPGLVAKETEAGDIDADGNWVTNRWMSMLREDHRQCPRSGKMYVLPAQRVGEHPYCPTHGHLIEESGYVPHTANPNGEWLTLLMRALFVSAIAVPTSAVIVIAVRTRRRKKKNHNKRLVEIPRKRNSTA